MPFAERLRNRAQPLQPRALQCRIRAGFPRSDVDGIVPNIVCPAGTAPGPGPPAPGRPFRQTAW
ncbi:hypothetical protein M2266_002125 [Streptomyces sp. SPB162]|nr:hypothetical protein [Streptomyces sp. SPB162]